MNSLRLVAIAGPVLAAMTVLPASSFAADSHACVSQEPTAQSYKWNFPNEAAGLLNDLQADAARAESHAATLQSLAANDQISWQAHAEQLEHLKSEVDDMGTKLCRLETIRRVVAPWEQKAIDRAAPDIRLLADNTQDALTYVRRNESEFWRPTYMKYTDNLYAESRQLSKSMKNFEEYAKSRSKELQLQKALELKTGA